MRTLILSALLALSSAASDLDEFKVKSVGPFEFAEAPAIKRAGDRIEISFAAKAACDVTVAIEDEAGRIVRHLASGVLGAQAPAPLEKNSLKQTLVWDGKNDAGKYLDEKDRLTVRVSLGLKPRFEKTLFWSPHKRVPFRVVTRQGSPASDDALLMAPAEEGVYVFDSGCDIDQLRLFGRQGDYLRSVYPFPAEKIAQVQGLQRKRFPQSGRDLPFKNFYYGTTLLTSGLASEEGDYRLHPSTRDAGSSAKALAARAGRVALSEVSLNRLAADGSSGGLPLSGPRVALRVTDDKGVELTVPPTSAALSPDGKQLYLTGYMFRGGRPSSADWDWLHVVLRVPFEGGKAEVFAGDPAKGKFGDGPNNFNAPVAVACDAAGRVYVADYLNNRIQVFGADGKHLKSVHVTRPAQLAVHHKTQELFVFSWYLANQMYFAGKGTDDDKALKPRLYRFETFERPKATAQYELPLVGHPPKRPYQDYTGMQFRAAVDTWSDPPTVWLSPGGTSHSTPLEKVGLRLLVPKDGKLVQVRDFAEDVTRTVVRQKPASEYRQRLYVNPAMPGLLLVGEGQVGVRKAFTTMAAIDVASGKVSEIELPMSAEDLCFGPDGLAYLRTGNEVVRYDSRTWSEVPWDYGDERKVSFSYDSKGADALSALVLPKTNTYWHHPGMGVNAMGELAVGCYTDSERHSRKEEKSMYAEGGGKSYQATQYPGRPQGATVFVWDRRGKTIREDALTSLGTVDGVNIDRDGNLYVGLGATRMLGQKAYFDYMTGTLAKLKPGETRALTVSSRVPVPLQQGSEPGRPRDLAGGASAPEWVEGAAWFYGGIGFSGLNAKIGKSCACWNYRCALDAFGRSFAPEVQHGSVAVLDTAGNVVVRVGRYGNVDDGMPLDKAGGPPAPQAIGGDEVALFYAPYLATHSDRRLFIADPGNARILSVKLGYHAEERIRLKDVPDQLAAER